jgi:hypothetical protein
MTPRLTDDQLRELTGVLQQTRPEELTCEEWLHHVGGYAEAIAAGLPVPLGSELIEHHLAICPECKEELDALVAVLRAGPDSAA